MDAVKFVQASKFVITAVDKAGVLADLRTPLKRNYDVSFQSHGIYSPKITTFTKKVFCRLVQVFVMMNGLPTAGRRSSVKFAWLKKKKRWPVGLERRVLETISSSTSSDL